MILVINFGWQIMKKTIKAVELFENTTPITLHLDYTHQNTQLAFFKLEKATTPPSSTTPTTFPSIATKTHKYPSSSKRTTTQKQTIPSPRGQLTPTPGYQLYPIRWLLRQLHPKITARGCSQTVLSGQQQVNSLSKLSRTSWFIQIVTEIPTRFSHSKGDGNRDNYRLEELGVFKREL